MKSELEHFRAACAVSHPSRGEWIEIERGGQLLGNGTSHPSRGEWIEISMRSPPSSGILSHPSRGEWIEMPWNLHHIGVWLCLTPHGVSGLKFNCRPHLVLCRCLTPHGVSGLKSVDLRGNVYLNWSHPSRGEWIEITDPQTPWHLAGRLTPHGVSGLKLAQPSA